MRIQIQNYGFNASAGTITFSDYASIDLQNIDVIINATRDEVLYNPLNEDLGGSVAGNVLTLDKNTATMGDNDELRVFYDDSELPATRDNQTSGDQRSKIYFDGKDVSVQNPIPTDGDSIYSKDVWVEESDASNWVDVDSAGGDVVLIPFNNLHTHIEYTGNDNPKTLLVHFNRTISARQIGLGCYQGVDSFSNVKIELLGSSGEVRNIINEKSNDTKYNSRNYDFEPSLFNGMKFYFYTDDDVCLSNITVQKAQLIESTIKDLDITELGTASTYEATTLVGTPFGGNVVDSNYWNTSVANDGTVTQNGQLTVTTGTTANGEAQITSNRAARKIPGALNQFRMVGKFTTEEDADNVRRIGVFDDDNGAFFKLNGTTCVIATRKGGVENEISESEFNGQVDELPKDTNVHRFVITYSAYRVTFHCDGNLIHEEVADTEAWTNTLTLPIRIESINSNNNTTDNGIEAQLATVLRLGRLHSESESNYQEGQVAAKVLKYGAGELKRVVLSGIDNGSIATYYDNTEASGEVLWSSGSMPSRTTPLQLDFGELPFSSGLTLAITNADCNATTVYE